MGLHFPWLGTILSANIYQALEQVFFKRHFFSNDLMSVFLKVSAEKSEKKSTSELSGEVFFLAAAAAGYDGSCVKLEQSCC